MLILRLSILENHESVIFRSAVKVLFIFKNAFWHFEICFVSLSILRLDRAQVFLVISRRKVVQILAYNYSCYSLGLI